MPESVVTLASTTSSQAELEHAASENWRAPFVPRTEETPAGTEPSTEGKSATESETVTTEQNKKTETKPDGKKPDNGWQKRVDRLTARNKSIETENATLKSRLDELERKVTAPAKETPTATVAKPAQEGPKLADYSTAEEWADARAEWNRTQERQREESTQSEQQIRETWDAHNGRISEARAKYDDFDEVAGAATIPIPQSAALAIIEQDNSADITYYLATHPDEAKKLLTLTPIKQIAAIVKISEKPELNGTPVAAAPKPKPTSQAPAPIKPVGGGATGTTAELGSMSYQDYKRARANGRR